MPNSICEVDECDRDVRWSGLCQKHYMRRYRHGDANADPSRHQKLAGQVFGNLTVLERVGSKWKCICSCGNEALTRSGDLNRGTTKSCGNLALHYRRPVLAYRQAHIRMSADHGRASERSCVDCGGQASDWSYAYRCDDYLVCSETGFIYCMEFEHYDPRCRRCHLRFDRAQRDTPTGG